MSELYKDLLCTSSTKCGVETRDWGMGHFHVANILHYILTAAAVHLNWRVLIIPSRGAVLAVHRHSLWSGVLLMRVFVYC